jgi:hypothetical protein
MALDCVELIGKAIQGNPRSYEYAEGRKSGISDINTRFKENGIGYQFENGQIIRTDSQYIHLEIIKPALKILSSSKYQGANDEFMRAHDCYRHGDFKQCLVECLKALESTIKVILLNRKISFSQSDNVKALIGSIFSNNIIPEYLVSHFTALRSTLESGTPTIRNKLGGHGQGEELKQVPEYMAAYALHLTAAGIVFLYNAEKSSFD